MRKINRGNPDPAFLKFASQKPVPSWKNLPSGLRQNITLQLLSEQDGLSGYTEKPIQENVHIDHFRKQDLFPKNILDWYNFVVDEHGKYYGEDHKDKNVKMGDYVKIIDPIQEDPHNFFDYMANGEIIPKKGLSTADEEKAKFTIDIFNLNHESLVDLRMTIMQMVEDCKKGKMLPHDISDCLKDCGFPSVIEYWIVACP